MDMTSNSFAWLNAILLTGTLSLGIAMKARDRRYVLAWLRRKFPRSRPRMALAAILGVEVALVAAEIAIGTNDDRFSLALAALLLVAAIVSARGATGDCPCFGALSFSRGLRPPIVFAGVAAAVAANHLLSIVLPGNRIVFCAVAAAYLAGAFVLGAKAVSTLYLGTPVGGGEDAAHADPVPAADKPAVVIFLSRTCPTCLQLLAFLEKYSVAFGSLVEFTLLIDGMDLEEDARYGDCLVLAQDPGLRQRFSVTSVPTMVVRYKSAHTKYVGAHACSLGLFDSAIRALDGAA